MFLHLCLTPIIGTPNNMTLKILTKDIFANVHAVTSTLGGSTHGHLGLVLPVTAYTTLAGIACQLPVHPSLTPMHASTGKTAEINEVV